MDLWTEEEWTHKVQRDPNEFIADLRREGMPVTGTSNGRPLFDKPEKIDWVRVQQIATGESTKAKPKKAPKAAPKPAPKKPTVKKKAAVKKK